MVQGGLQRLGDWISGPFLGTRLGLIAAMIVYAGTQWLEAPEPRYTHDEILEALRLTESGGMLHPPDGDGGRAIGPYQIHRIYWVDTRLPGDYQDCRKRDYAEQVIRAYMRRWVPEAWERRDAEIIARTHNGGPRGRTKRATDKYWRKVADRLQEIRRRSLAEE